MTTTDKLLKLGVADLSGSDLLRLWNQSYGGEAALSLTQLLAWIEDQVTLTSKTTQYAAPSATDFSVSITNANTWLILTPTGTFADGTIVLPSGVDKAEILVTSTEEVTALVVTPASGDSAIAAPTTIAADGSFRLRFDGVVRAWYKVA